MKIPFFHFSFGEKRLVFFSAEAPDAMPEGSSESGKPGEGAESAEASVDILVEIAREQGSAAIMSARQMAAQLRAKGGGKPQDESQAMFDVLATQGKGLASDVPDPAHSDRHMGNVLQNAMEIIKELAKIQPDFNVAVAAVSSIWHDIGRSEDPAEHESLSALKIHNEALKLGFSLETATQLFNAIAHHKWSDEPKTVEGHIVRDADKLDFLDPERWRKRIEGKKYDELKYVTDIFLNLRDRLKLEASKKIFDVRLPSFLGFIKGVQDENFEPMKKQILSIPPLS